MLAEIFSTATLTDILDGWGSMAGPTTVILISGKAGVGKTTLQRMLVEYLKTEYPLVVPMAFARPLKDVATNLGWDGVKDERGRKLLQQLGGVLREYNKDTWVILSLDKVYEITAGTPPNFIVFDDWRFPNESAMIDSDPDYKTVKIRINAPTRETLKGQREYLDSSELALDSYADFDIIIQNDTITLEELRDLGIKELQQFLEKED